MPERAAFVEAIRAGRPLALGAVAILPIERVAVQLDRGRSGAWFSAAKEPWALIVRDAGGVCAIDTGGAPIAIEELRARVPGLDAVLAQM